MSRSSDAADPIDAASTRAHGRTLLSEERARAVWQRAAQLQAEAAQRLEESSLRLAGDAGAGFRLTDVEAAAVEAGIAPEFVRLALAEVAGHSDDVEALPRWMDRWATWLLGTDRRRLEVTRRIAASPADVFEAMKRVFPNPPYALVLREMLGEHPLSGGVLWFDVPPHRSDANEAFAHGLAYAGVKQLHVALRASPRRAGQACEVIVSADLRANLRSQVWIGGATTGATGGGGLVAGGSAAAAIGAGVFGTAGVALGALVVAAAAARLGAAGYGALYRWGQAKGWTVLEDLLRALDRNATGDPFAIPAAPPE